MILPITRGFNHGFDLMPEVFPSKNNSRLTYKYVDDSTASDDPNNVMYTVCCIFLYPTDLWTDGIPRPSFKVLITGLRNSPVTTTEKYESVTKHVRTVYSRILEPTVSTSS
jgi:hypothetical protein